MTSNLVVINDSLCLYVKELLMYNLKPYNVLALAFVVSHFQFKKISYFRSFHGTSDIVFFG